MRRIFETQQMLMAHRIEDALRGADEEKIRRAEWKRLTEARLDASQKTDPGSVFRSGAMSEWPRTASIGYAVSNAAITEFSARYCASANASKSVPSSSMPIEKSLHAVRPLNSETPACHARSRERYELRHRPIALDQDVRRYAHAGDLREIGIGRNVERIGEQSRYMAAAVADRAAG